jgi:hypothetical protein
MSMPVRADITRLALTGPSLSLKYYGNFLPSSFAADDTAASDEDDAASSRQPLVLEMFASTPLTELVLVELDFKQLLAVLLCVPKDHHITKLAVGAKREPGMRRLDHLRLSWTKWKGKSQTPSI